MPKLETTLEQKAFIKTFCQKTPCFLSARAGTGKTTTIKLAIEEALSSKSLSASEILCIAFNKANQLDLAKALPPEIKVSTLHAIGLQTLRSLFPHLSIEKDKIYRLTAEEGFTGKNARDSFAQTMQLVSAAKNWGLLPLKSKGGLFKKSLFEDTAENWIELQEHFNLLDADPSKARNILIKSNTLAKKGEIDFDDMVYLPVVLDLMPILPDYVLVDEAQDLSPLNLSLIKKIPSKVWYIGDPFQAIYGWRGAVGDILSQTSQNGKELPVLPLTNCWRCSRNIIKEAQKLVPDILTTNPEGASVKRPFEIDFSQTPKSTILARRNSTLVTVALSLREKHIPVVIFGRDFAKTLIATLNKLKGTTSLQLKDSLLSYIEALCTKYPHRAPEFRDEKRCLQAVLSEVSGKREAEKLISSLFSDEETDDTWILSTIHHAKGKEWDRVFLVEWTPKVDQPWQKIEERNLKYVAITRARKELMFLSERMFEPAENQNSDASPETDASPESSPEED